MIDVHGHRGCRGHLPENTLPSFAAAIDAGAHTLEMDLLITQDGKVVVYHDFHINIELCTYASGAPIREKILIRDLTLAKIKEIDCGSCRHAEFPFQKTLPGTKIPTLEEVLEMAKEKSIKLNLEIKRDADYPEYTFPPDILAQTIVKTVAKSGLGPKVHYSSFDVEILTEIRKISPEAKLTIVVAETLEGIIEKALPLKALMICPEHSLLKTAEDILKLQSAGFRVATWTVNTQERWQELIEMGVDGIITDYPQDLLLFLGKTRPFL